MIMIIHRRVVRASIFRDPTQPNRSTDWHNPSEHKSNHLVGFFVICKAANNIQNRSDVISATQCTKLTAPGIEFRFPKEHCRQTKPLSELWITYRVTLTGPLACYCLNWISCSGWRRSVWQMRICSAVGLSQLSVRKWSWSIADFSAFLILLYHTAYSIQRKIDKTTFTNFGDATNC